MGVSVYMVRFSIRVKPGNIFIFFDVFHFDKKVYRPTRIQYQLMHV